MTTKDFEAQNYQIEQNQVVSYLSNPITFMGSKAETPIGINSIQFAHSPPNVLSDRQSFSPIEVNQSNNINVI